jgi:hypothetical protein
MPYNFTGQSHSYKAKLGVVADGDTFTGSPTVLTSGSTATLTLSGSTVTLTGGAGFTSGMNGDKIYISNAATSANNGWFTLTYISATSVSWTNASGATDAHNGAIGFQVAALGVSTLSSAPSPYTIFAGAPVRSATGVWSATLKDIAVRVCNVDVTTVLPSGEYLVVQQLPDTKTSGGALVVNWVFNNAGTPTDLPYPGQFRLFCEYSETREGF